MRRPSTGRNCSNLLSSREAPMRISRVLHIASRVRALAVFSSAFSDCFAEDLASKKRTSEAAQVLLDYAKDAREAAIALVEGSHFSEARRIVSASLPLYRTLSPFKLTFSLAIPDRSASPTGAH